MGKTEFPIGQRLIGGDAGSFIIAEIGINHDGSLSRAVQLIDAAAEAGADAVKFQSYRTDRLLIESPDRYAQQQEGTESAYQMLRRCELSWEDQEKLRKHAAGRGIEFLSTPFDEESADFLDSIGVPAFKIASGDLTHVFLLRRVAAKRKPIFLSTGMAYLDEVADAIDTLNSAGAEDIVPMHCVSAYPASPEQMNLRSLHTMRSHFGLPVGLSDHTRGILVTLSAVALGAVVVEKHFTLDKNAPGPDHNLSMDPDDLKQLIRSVREMESSLGDGRKRPSDAEQSARVLARRSIVAAVDIPRHETILPHMLTYKRPASGLEPRYAEQVIGMSAGRDIAKDTAIRWEDLIPAPPDSQDKCNA